METDILKKVCDSEVRAVKIKILAPSWRICRGQRDVESFFATTTHPPTPTPENRTQVLVHPSVSSLDSAPETEDSAVGGST